MFPLKTLKKTLRFQSEHILPLLSSVLFSTSALASDKPPLPYDWYTETYQTAMP